ncbi:PEPxxWA-CTERM sorting domain-containing protein [Sphingomonas sp.]|uniref:PEPxxWA-CTERM sorting domain-containing protein n=1 Tax=Sphingomonas sp. TaxID=28214 RepID=UPI0025D3C4A0|nr:PEPxxWA-CTERM sorting domain-containing protein [Sphingomonas sp.]
MKNFRKIGAFVLVGIMGLGATQASAVSLSLTKLSGLTGTVPNNGTAVYRADLSVLSGDFAAIAISDASGNFGGSPGTFSGFDLDAIKLSTTNCATASCAASAVGLDIFDFTSGVVFTPGTQRAPVDAKLFGTDASGMNVDNAVATLGAFDGVSSTVIPFGFLSLGDMGSVAFNLTSLTSGAGLYLYIGEVGDNGEVAGSNINVLSTPVSRVPEPATWAMFIGGFGLVGGAMRRQRRTGVHFA